MNIIIAIVCIAVSADDPELVRLRVENAALKAKVEWYAAHNSPSHAATTPQPPAVEPPSQPVVQTKPVVDVWLTAGDWCPSCNVAKPWLDDTDLPFSPRVHYDDPGYGGAIPYFLWIGDDGREKYFDQNYSPTRSNVISAWRGTVKGTSPQKPQAPQPQQGKLCQCVAVTGNRQAYCPCLPLGKGCHCSPSKPHRFE